ncbi:MAG: transporter [Deferribacteraceae bacterium]|jgi:hypothetical protein|nr:transporter [Deferribacteraceae bacterium]
MKRFFVFLAIFAFSAYVYAADQPISFGPYDSGWYPDNTYGVYMTGVRKASPAVDMNMGLFILSTVQTVFEVPVHAHIMLAAADLRVEGVGKTSGTRDMQFALMPRLFHWEGGHVNIRVAVEAPTGSYDKNSYLNIGSNRWGFSPSLALAQDAGRFHFELWGGYDFYTNNKDFLYYATETDLEKDGNFYAEIHATFKIEDEGESTVTLSLGGIWGGEENAEISGATHRIRDKMADYACKATLKTNITNTFFISVMYTYDLHTENGEKGYSIATKLAKIF